MSEKEISQIMKKLQCLEDKIDEHIVEHKKNYDEIKAHMAEVTPYVQSFKGVKLLGDSIKWIAMVIAGAGAILYTIKTWVMN